MSFAADSPIARHLARAEPPAGPPLTPGAVRFQDRGGLFGLLVKNWFLTLVTVGIYRFWARAALRRYWWGSITLAGDPLEYTGTGLELFIGFLMFLGIMLPIGVVYGLVALLTDGKSPLAIGTRVVEALIFFVLVQFVTFRARRYRLSRTLWRGVRASQGGTSWQYLRLVVGWSLLSAVTLGIAVPWSRMATTRYLTDRTALGNFEARFDGRGRDLIGPWLFVLIPFAIMVYGFIVLGVHVAKTGAATKFPAGTYWIFGGEIVGLLGFLAYLLIELRYTIQHTRFGGIQLGSSLPIFKLSAKVIGLGLLIGLIACLVVALAFVVIGFTTNVAKLAGGAAAGPSAAAIIIAVLGCVLSFALTNILRVVLIDTSIVRHICESLSLSHPELLDQIGQSTAAMPLAGEGLADSFDIGAF